MATCVVASSLVEVVRHLPGQRLGDHLGAGVADAVELGQRPGGRPLGDLRRVGVAHDVAGPLERLGPEARVVGPVQAVHHPVEGGLRRHPVTVPPTPSSVPGTGDRRTPLGSTAWTRGSSPSSTSAACTSPSTTPTPAKFTDALDEVNALAESSPGFVWRLKDEATGLSSSYVRTSDDPLEIVNLSVWEYARRSCTTSCTARRTRPFLRRRREWFQKVELFLVCWWVPAGHRPSVDEALAPASSSSAGGPERRSLHPAGPPPGAPGAHPRQRELAVRTASIDAVSTDGPGLRATVASVVGRMERFGLVGLPNAGKSSLYNALTGGGALAAPYAFATKDPNIGVARVPDERLDRLAEMSSSRNVVHAAVQVVDIGGLVEGASKGEGLGNKFLANIREVDAIVFVLRAFVDDDVTGPSDPHRAPARRRDRARPGRPRDGREAPRPRRPASPSSTSRSATRSPRCRSPSTRSSDGRPLYRAGLKPEHRELLAPYFLLTNRRVLAVVNVGEDELDDIPAIEARIAAEFNDAGDNVEVIGMCVQLEAEAAAIEDPVERAEMLEGFGLGEGALFRMVRSAYHLLGLRTFLTTGDKESRAWTFYDGSTAPQCAGRIHTDFQRGFIRAEVVQWDELLGIGSWNKAKDLGKIRLEGKDYIARDGDVMEFRFNV